jgi:hypothetical protein
LDKTSASSAATLPASKRGKGGAKGRGLSSDSSDNLAAAAAAAIIAQSPELLDRIDAAAFNSVRFVSEVMNINPSICAIFKESPLFVGMLRRLWHRLIARCNSGLFLFRAKSAITTGNVGTNAPLDVSSKTSSMIRITCEVLMTYWRTELENLDILTGFIAVFGAKNVSTDLTFLINFFQGEVPKLITDLSVKKKLLRRAFTFIASTHETAEQKVKHIQVVK